jgi:pyrroloquinoline quinone biosynthesis protein D
VNPLDLNLRPALAPHVRLKTDPVSGEPVLLFPEGLLILNDTAHEIVHRCDGQTSIAELLKQLNGEFEVDEETLRHDILENLQQLKQRNLILFSE